MSKFEIDVDIDKRKINDDTIYDTTVSYTTTKRFDNRGKAKDFVEKKKDKINQMKDYKVETGGESQCLGETSDGSRCERTTSHPTGYCYQHR